MNWNEYQTAYQAADQTTKDKLHSSLIPECVGEAVTKYELDSSHRRILIKIFSRKTVGLHDDASTAEAMREAGIPAAAVICKKINQCMATKTPAIADTSLVEDGQTGNKIGQSVPVNTTTTPVTTVQQPTVANPHNNQETPSNTLAAEIAETEAAFKQLQPIRTMAHDMETIKQVEEPVHQAASQETILNGQGNAQKNESAQWGTPEK
jgi:hypothetical protein